MDNQEPMGEVTIFLAHLVLVVILARLDLLVLADKRENPDVTVWVAIRVFKDLLVTFS